mmetsp:Transcript_21912/g.62367  ORF Transcript_21912/g.62367 Transcript_21912/m.62367 type:complete len:98 (+) Transcript_21912:280-573(+)
MSQSERTTIMHTTRRRDRHHRTPDRPTKPPTFHHYVCVSQSVILPAAALAAPHTHMAHHPCVPTPRYLFNCLRTMSMSPSMKKAALSAPILALHWPP